MGVTTCPSYVLRTTYQVDNLEFPYGCFEFRKQYPRRPRSRGIKLFLQLSLFLHLSLSEKCDFDDNCKNISNNQNNDNCKKLFYSCRQDFYLFFTIVVVFTVVVVFKVVVVTHDQTVMLHTISIYNRSPRLVVRVSVRLLTIAEDESMTNHV